MDELVWTGRAWLIPRPGLVHDHPLVAFRIVDLLARFLLPYHKMERALIPAQRSIGIYKAPLQGVLDCTLPCRGQRASCSAVHRHCNAHRAFPYDHQ